MALVMSRNSYARFCKGGISSKAGGEPGLKISYRRNLDLRRSLSRNCRLPFATKRSAIIPKTERCDMLLHFRISTSYNIQSERSLAIKPFDDLLSF